MQIEALKLEVLYATHGLIGQALELEEALREILRILAEKLEMARAAVVLYDEEAGHLRIQASFGLSPQEERRGIYQVGEGVTGKVFETGEPGAVADISQEPFFLNRTRARPAKEKISFIAVPIRFGEKTLGVLWVDRLFHLGVPLEEDVRFLEVIAFFVGQLVGLARRVADREKALRAENFALRTELTTRLSDFLWGSKSPAMREVLNLVRQVAPTRATVLLLGESGTGKTLTARLIHELSPRREGPFLKVDCTALPENLLEAELFGYERGAFTGADRAKPGRLELAEGGTVFLDEIGELPLSLQGKLLRFIQERAFERLGGRRTIQVDVRLIAATNRDLETLVKEGLFREDLYFRLQVFPIKLPPLRERREDLPGLIEFLLRKLEKDYHRRLNFSPEALELLCQYHWPGNIRELENLLERLLITAKGPVRPEFLRRFLATKPAQQLWPRKDPSPEEIRAALEKHDFVIARAAKELGLTFRQLRYRLKKWGLDREIKPRRGRPPQK